jgi:zinc transporter 1
VASFVAKARTIRECLHAYGIHSTTLQPELLMPGLSPPPSPLFGLAEAVRMMGQQQQGGGGGGGEGEGEGEGATAGGGGAAGEKPAVPCQIVCGKGMCGPLTCCSNPV